MNQQKTCAIDYWKNDAPDPRNGTYDAYTYRDDLTTVLSNHDSSERLFLYLPLHNVHDPFQVPQEWLESTHRTPPVANATPTKPWSVLLTMLLDMWWSS